jgi:hypothetical protein
MMDLGASRGFLNVTGDCGGLGRRYALATSQPNIEGRFWGGGVVTGGASVSVKSGCVGKAASERARPWPAEERAGGGTALRGWL